MFHKLLYTFTRHLSFFSQMKNVNPNFSGTTKLKQLFSTLSWGFCLEQKCTKNGGFIKTGTEFRKLLSKKLQNKVNSPCFAIYSYFSEVTSILVLNSRTFVVVHMPRQGIIVAKIFSKENDYSRNISKKVQMKNNNLGGHGKLS